MPGAPHEVGAAPDEEASPLSATTTKGGSSGADASSSSTLVRDVVAGVTLALTSVPQAIAYYEVLGLEGWRGLATMGVPCMLHSLVTGSPWASVGVTSMTALTARGVLARGRSNMDDEGYMSVVAGYACCVGVASLIFAGIGLGNVAVNRLPKSVAKGFKLGFGLAVACSQLGTAVLDDGNASLKTRSEHDWPVVSKRVRRYAMKHGTVPGLPAATRFVWVLTHPWRWDVGASGVSMAVAFCVFALAAKSSSSSSQQRDRRRQPFPLQLLHHLLPPGAEVLVAVAVASLAAKVFEYAGAAAGAPPPGANLYVINMPLAIDRLSRVVFKLDNLRLVGSSFLFAAVDFLQTVSVCATLEEESGVPWSPNRELAAQGIACVASGYVGGGPCGASLSRSLVARMAKAASPRAGLVHGLCAVLFLPQLGRLALPHVPKAALAAVVLVAVAPGLVYPKQVLQLGLSLDGLVAWVTALSCVACDPATGFLAGLFLALVLAPFTSSSSRGGRKGGQQQHARHAAKPKT